MLTVHIDFKVGTRFGVEDTVGEQPVHDTITERYRHLDFYQHECVPGDLYFASSSSTTRLRHSSRASSRP